LDGDAMRDIEAALAVHDRQMEIASRAEIVEAMGLVGRRIDEGHAYREAA
jgi:hypothetical protein